MARANGQGYAVSSDVAHDPSGLWPHGSCIHVDYHTNDAVGETNQSGELSSRRSKHAMVKLCRQTLQ